MEGEGTGVGRPTLERHFPGAIVTHNLLIGGEVYADRYPESNAFPVSAEAAFLNAAGGDYRLAKNGALAAAPASAREVPGIDAQALCAALGDMGEREAVCSKPVSKDHAPTAQAGKRE
jgi:hypothetical protein